MIFVITTGLAIAQWIGLFYYGDFQGFLVWIVLFMILEVGTVLCNEAIPTQDRGGKWILQCLYWLCSAALTYGTWTGFFQMAPLLTDS